MHKLRYANYETSTVHKSLNNTYLHERVKSLGFDLLRRTCVDDVTKGRVNISEMSVAQGNVKRDALRA